MKNGMYGFTLAEVLVTLGIIGVVSAMTVPSLMQNYQRQSYVTQLHKVYNELNQAGMSFINSKNALNMKEAGFSGNEGTFLSSNFKVVKDCGNKPDTCFADTYNSMGGKKIEHIITNTMSKCVVIASGAAMCLGSAVETGLGIDGKGTWSYGAARVYVDINGRQGPNILGRDFFDFVINDDGSVGGLQSLHGSSMDSELATLKTHCSSYEKPLASQQLTENDGACFNYLLKNNWEMDY
ncbi:MAG: hypothetical protein BHW55_04395 [Candidatus Melainabacteria bacterium 35_41]|jgi:prepilin-type cleavage/methylation N-terminal domain protein|nr:MAG: hypothetical protein BHW55_04395 [Candidatus Melainabacteria bacterium 35_41]